MHALRLFLFTLLCFTHSRALLGQDEAYLPHPFWTNGFARTGWSWAAGGIPLPNDPLTSGSVPALRTEVPIHAYVDLARRGSQHLDPPPFSSYPPSQWKAHFYGDTLAPANVVIGFPIGHLALAAGFQRSYRNDVYQEELTDLSAIVDTWRDFRLSHTFLSAAWARSRWSLGGSLAWQRITTSVKSPGNRGGVQDLEAGDGSGWRLGLSAAADPLSTVSVAMAARWSFPFDVDYAYAQEPARGPSTYSYPAGVPDEYDLIAAWKPVSPLRLQAMARRRDWRGDIDSLLTERWDVHTGFVAEPHPRLQLAAGWVLTGEPVKATTRTAWRGHYEGDYHIVTGGMRLGVLEWLRITIQMSQILDRGGETNLSQPGWSIGIQTELPNGTVVP